MGMISTGYMKANFGLDSVRRNLKDMVIWLFSGAIPATANAAETGTRIVKITEDGATVKVKQKITITPVVGDANGAVWNVTLNGITAKFTDDGTPSVSEVCTGLYNALKVLNGTAITTPASVIDIPETYGLFTITNNTTNVTVEAATAGVSFEYSSTVVGGTTATLTSVLTTDNAYGIRFEAYSDISSGILEMLAGHTWKGLFLSDGVITHARIQSDDDTGAASSVLVRMQGIAATANAEFIVSHTDGKTGEEISCTVGTISMGASV